MSGLAIVKNAIDPELRAVVALENLLRLTVCQIGKYSAEREPICVEAGEVIEKFWERTRK